MASSQRKQNLVQQLRSHDEQAVMRAFEELRENGGLQDGTLAGADLDEVQLPGVDLSKADMQGAVLIGANLRGARLDEVKVRGIGLRDADLRGAFLNGADMMSAMLLRAQLQGADLSSSNLNKADLTDALLDGALLYNANLEGAANATDKQLASTYAMWGVTMPDGTHYDGRFQLAGDTAAALARGIDSEDALAMGRFYEVHEATYVAALHWSRTVLSTLRNETAYQAAMNQLWNSDGHGHTPE